MTPKIVYTCDAQENGVLCNCDTVITQDGNDFYFVQAGMNEPVKIETINELDFVNESYSIANTAKGNEFIALFHKTTKG